MRMRMMMMMMMMMIVTMSTDCHHHSNYYYYFIIRSTPSYVYLCVADGVGSWRGYGVDPRDFSHR